MLHRHFASFIIAIVVGLSVAPVAQAQPRAVVELFTSQGCSSCPAADRLAGQLALDPSLVVLSLPVDYWDYLGWKDTLADPRNTLRQRAYARERGDRQVYTPQVVINGVVHTLGSDKDGIERAIVQSRRNASALSVPVQMSRTNDEVTVSLGAGAGAQQGEVWACSVRKVVPVEVARGENRGRVVTYHNVARRWIKLGDWTGKPETLTVSVGEFKRDGADALAVLVQGGSREKPGLVLGAGSVEIR